jgi:hypothetical protein
MRMFRGFLSIAFLAIAVAGGGASGQTTAFVYQGKLTDNGAPAEGPYLMRFELFDAVASGTQIGSTLTDLPVVASGGIVTVTLDFGAPALSGANRWLEIAVKKTAGESYSLLSPREQITSSPYAIRSLSAATADVALDAQKLGGKLPSEYVTTTGVGTAFINNQTTVQAGANFNIAGNGTIGGKLGVGMTAVAKIDANGGSGDGIRGVSTGGGRGVWGESESWQGVYGKSNTQAGVVGESNTFYGVYGITHIPSAAGLYGSNTTDGMGIVGESATNTAIKGTSTSGAGVHGLSTSGWGVYGQSSSSAGVVGGSGSYHGVYGSSGNANGAGVFGTNTNGGIGVQGSVASGVAVLGGVSQTGAIGVRGDASAVNSTGVKGQANAANSIGVWGQADLNTGVFGLTTSGWGLYGRSVGSGLGLYSDGNAGQTRDKGGIVKAMVYVNGDGTLIRCYNGVTGAASCTGFSSARDFFPAGDYHVDFPFQTDDRFYEVSVEEDNGGVAVTYSKPSTSRIKVNVCDVVVTSSGNCAHTDRPVMIIVY